MICLICAEFGLVALHRIDETNPVDRSNSFSLALLDGLFLVFECSGGSSQLRRSKIQVNVFVPETSILRLRDVPELVDLFSCR